MSKSTFNVWVLAIISTCVSSLEATAASLSSSIAAGQHHSMMTRCDGAVLSWGGNDFGQLGNGTTTASRSPIRSPTSAVWVQSIYAGSNSSFALKTDKTALAWGKNTYGQLGNGLTKNSSIPVAVITTGMDAPMKAMASGGDYTLALTTNGSVYAWGYNGPGHLGNDSTIRNSTKPVWVSALHDVVAISASENHSLAVETDGTVWAWGDNISGELGDDTTDDKHHPVQVVGLSSATSVSAGENHSLAVATDGTVWAWGDNYSGELGDSTTDDKYHPVQVTGISNVVAASACNYFSLALKNDGTVWAWGSNWAGQLGNNTTTDDGSPSPVSTVSGMTNVVAIACGQDYSMAMTVDGSVWTWGVNDAGQLGNGTTTNQLTPTKVRGCSNASVSAGYLHSISTKTDGSAWAWGYNHDGQLANGNTTTQKSPVRVFRLGGAAKTIAMSAGSGHSLHIQVENNGVLAAGSNTLGESGATYNPSTFLALSPVTYSSNVGLTNVKAVAAGNGLSLAVKTDGTVWHWGGTAGKYVVQSPGLSDVVSVAIDPNGNQLALKSDGSVWVRAANNVPSDFSFTQVVGLSNVVAVSAGSGYILVLKPDGTVWTSSTSFNPSPSPSGCTPTQVSGLSDIIAISAGAAHSLALKGDGTVYSWGSNSRGQLGDGTNTARTGIFQVPLPTIDIWKVSAGDHHSLAVTSDGTVYAWGGNSFGELGTGGTTDQYTPVKVF